MPIMDVAAFDFLAPAAESVAPAVFDTAAFEGLGAEAGLGATDFLGSMSGVNALENPAVAQQMANQQMAQGITSGGVGAAQGSAEQLALQQAKAAEIANSGIQQASKPLYEMTNQETNDLISRTIKPEYMNSLTPQESFKQEVAQGLARPTVANTPTGVDYSFNTGSINNMQTPGYQSYLTRPDLASGASTGTQALSAGISDGGIRTAMTQLPTPELSPLEQGFNTATKFIKDNPYTSAGIAYMGASKLGLLNQPRAQFGDVGAPYNGPLTRYRMSPDFKPRFADPTQFQYKPSYAAGGVMDVGRNPVEQMSNQNSIGANTGFPQAYIHNNAFATPTQTPISQNVLTGSGDTGVDPYTGEQNMAAGGIAHFSAGKSVNASNLSDSLNYYSSMIGGPADQQMAQMYTPTGGQGDVGIIRDTDPDTAYLSAPEAAAVRMGKINARSNMQGPTLPRPTPMGRINLRPQGVKQAAASGYSLDPEVNAAAGGIMGASLGGYAAGGNPRLLKGPGDGMSDNIPAVIADKQPARLADGEFVVPADVVSHLGNGSTDAGAKKLHHMMDTVRKARTGNQKQGKQIDPNKYLPT